MELELGEKVVVVGSTGVLLELSLGGLFWRGRRANGIGTGSCKDTAGCNKIQYGVIYSTCVFL
jgi:hypothetical protein